MKLRRSVLLAFAASIVIAAYLGFADLSLPNDKTVHFVVFFFITALFYWLFDTSSLRFIRTLTLIVCTFAGAIGSEFIQAILPYRTFDIWDIVSNIFGSLTGLTVSVYYHKKELEAKRRLRYEQLRNSIPPDPETEDVNFDMDLEAGYSSHSSSQLNDLSRFTSTDHIPLKNVEPEPVDDMEVE